MGKDQAFDLKHFKREAIKGMYAGKSLKGEKSIFAPPLKHFLEAALTGSPPAGRKSSGIIQLQKWPDQQKGQEPVGR